MAYFLKVQKQANNTYLAIYESFYSRESKGTKHRCVQSLGSVSSLIASGISDPVAYYKAEVERMNQERNPPYPAPLRRSKAGPGGSVQ